MYTRYMDDMTHAIGQLIGIIDRTILPSKVSDVTSVIIGQNIVNSLYLIPNEKHLCTNERWDYSGVES